MTGKKFFSFTKGSVRRTKTKGGQARIRTVKAHPNKLIGRPRKKK